MRTLLCLTALLAGCIARQPNADAPEADALLAAPDATREGGVRDADAPDAADAAIADAAIADAAAPRSRMARFLSCDLTREAALDSVVRLVACLPALRDDRRTTVPGLFEAWEAGLFAGVGGTAQITSPVPLQFGCPAMRCLVDAPDCDAARRCLATPVDPDPAPDVECEPGWEQCVDGRVVRCSETGREYVAMDCGALDTACVPAGEMRGRAACALAGCEIPLSLNARRCDGDDLVLCDGVLRLDCAEWRPEGQCQSFAIGGEIPIDFCGPPGFGGAGAYNQPVDCLADGVMQFTTLGTDTWRYDCRGRGYRGCDARGCLP